MSLLKQLKFKLWYDDPSKFYKDIYKEEPTSYQSRVLKLLPNFQINRIIICAAGGTGKTKLLACIALWYATVLAYFVGRKEVIIISGSEDQAKHLYDFCRFAILDTPEISEKVMDKPLISLTRFKDRSVIRALSKSFKKILGKHGELVIIDEAVLVENRFLRDALRIIPDSKYSRIILSSTPQEAKGDLFLEYWENEKKYPDWHREHWTAFECPWKKQLSEEAKRQGREWYDIFFLGRPHPISNILIPIDKIHKASRNNPKFEYNINGDPPIMGLDLGGFKNPADITIRQTIDGIDYIIYRGEKMLKDPNKPDEILDWIQGLFEQYNVKRIYSDSLPRAENARLIARGLPVTLITLQQDTRARYQANMRRKMLDHKVKIPEEYVKLLWQLKKYDWNTKENDDAVVSFMLSLIDEPRIESNSFYIKTGKIRRRR